MILYWMLISWLDSIFKQTISHEICPVLFVSIADIEHVSYSQTNLLPPLNLKTVQKGAVLEYVILKEMKTFKLTSTHTVARIPMLEFGARARTRTRRRGTARHRAPATLPLHIYVNFSRAVLSARLCTCAPPVLPRRHTLIRGHIKCQYGPCMHINRFTVTMKFQKKITFMLHGIFFN